MRVIRGQLSILFSVTDTQESRRTLMSSLSLPIPLLPLKLVVTISHTLACMAAWTQLCVQGGEEVKKLS